MFNIQDLKNLQVFLERVDLKGRESMAHAELVIKIANMRAELESDPSPPPEKDDPSED